MIQNNNLKMRAVALLTGGAIASTIFLQPAPAQAADKEQLYKGGAAVLGVLGAYWGLKGDLLPGAIAGAGAYYAYKKGQDVSKDDRYDDYDRNRRRDNYRSDDYYRNDRRSSRNDYRRDDNYRNDNYRYDDYRYNNLDPSVVLR